MRVVARITRLFPRAICARGLFLSRARSRIFGAPALNTSRFFILLELTLALARSPFRLEKGKFFHGIPRRRAPSKYCFIGKARFPARFFKGLKEKGKLPGN